jgi:hypothetical protein
MEDVTIPPVITDERTISVDAVPGDAGTPACSSQYHIPICGGLSEILSLGACERTSWLIRRLFREVQESEESAPVAGTLIFAHPDPSLPPMTIDYDRKAVTLRSEYASVAQLKVGVRVLTAIGALASDLPLLPIHMAAVEMDDSSIGIVAGSGVGKSYLCRELERVAPCRQVVQDWTVVRADTREVLAEAETAGVVRGPEAAVHPDAVPLELYLGDPSSPQSRFLLEGGNRLELPRPSRALSHLVVLLGGSAGDAYRYEHWTADRLLEFASRPPFMTDEALDLLVVQQRSDALSRLRRLAQAVDLMSIRGHRSLRSYAPLVRDIRRGVVSNASIPSKLEQREGDGILDNLSGPD